MLTVFSAILYTVAVLIAILLVALVLVQPSKGGGFGAAFGGVGEGVFGAQTIGYLSKLTVVLITVFFIVTLTLAALSGHKQRTVSAAASSAALAPAALAPAVSGSADKSVDKKSENMKKQPETPIKK